MMETFLDTVLVLFVVAFAFIISTRITEALESIASDLKRIANRAYEEEVNKADLDDPRKDGFA